MPRQRPPSGSLPDPMSYPTAFPWMVAAGATCAPISSPLAPPSAADIFRKYATQHPNIVALETADAVVTYARLWELACAATNFLHANGVKRGQVVALRLPRGVRWYACTVACMRLGSPFLWLTGGSTQAELAFDAEALHVLKPVLVVEATKRQAEGDTKMERDSQGARYVLHPHKWRG